jgi:SAM-dependent methyltransferase
MPLITSAELARLLACPRCRAPLVGDGTSLVCSSPQCPHHEEPFPSVAGMPVLVDFGSSVLLEDDVVGREGRSLIPRERSIAFRTARRMLVPQNRVAERNVSRLRELLAGAAPRPRVLVVGGGVIGNGVGALYEDPSIDVIGFDIYASGFTQFIADAHRIPLADASIDAVLVQGVLPCVLEPWTVVAEIHRVLRADGLVYSETSFMQQVCEGPYDFTRFTESGHRHLYKRFELIDSGVVAGPATQLLWSIDHFARGVFRSRTAGTVAKGLFSWLRLLDRVFPESYAVDDAAAVYLLGRRSDGVMTPRAVVAHYKGAQR